MEIKQTDIKTSTDVSGPATSSIKTESGGQETTVVATDWQAKMNADAQSSKDNAVSISYLTGQNKALIPIGVKEVALTGPSISILLTDISVDRKNWKVSGNIENKGAKAIKAASVFFSTTDKEYRPIDTVEIRMLNNINVLTTGYGDLQEVKPGQKLSFESAPIQNEYSSNPRYLERQKTATFLAVEYK